VQSLLHLGVDAKSSSSEDPLGGHLFVFRVLRGNRIKMLWWNSDGMCMCAERLEQGYFVWSEAKTGSVHLSFA
jgi:transposase